MGSVRQVAEKRRDIGISSQAHYARGGSVPGDTILELWLLDRWI